MPETKVYSIHYIKIKICKIVIAFNRFNAQKVVLKKSPDLGMFLGLKIGHLLSNFCHGTDLHKAAKNRFLLRPKINFAEFL